MKIQTVGMVLACLALVTACGAEGPQGIQGPPGPAGADADGSGTGVDGAGGTDGDHGANGARGLAGPPGPQGPAGEDGLAVISETDGTRLKARYTTTTITGSDGSKQVIRSFVGWCDTQRNEPCSVRTSADGKSRCLPHGGWSNDYWLDATCSTTQIAFVDTNVDMACDASVDAAPKYARMSTGGVDRIRMLGSKVALSKGQPYYQRLVVSGQSECFKTTLVSNEVAYRVLDEEIPSSSFVEMSSATETK